MKRFIILNILLVLVVTSSCKKMPNSEESIERNKNHNPTVNVQELQKDFIEWWTYHKKDISLSSNFLGIDENFKKIEKQQFLEKLSSGSYIPIALESKENFKSYKLYKLDSLADKRITTTIINESQLSLKYLKMEGTRFPEYDFKDIKGNQYSDKTSKGNYIIFKTWFINCKACVAEFPELNEFVEKYKEDSDILFTSLALNSKMELEKFLKKKEFEYDVIPDQKEFISKVLDLHIYPSHIIVDKNGIIMKVTNKASEMISFFNDNYK